MTKKEMIKSGVKLVAVFGVGSIVTNAVAFTTPSIDLGVLKRVAIGIGSLALSVFAAEKVSNYVDEKIDDIFEEAKKMISEEKEVVA